MMKMFMLHPMTLGAEATHTQFSWLFLFTSMKLSKNKRWKKVLYLTVLYSFSLSYETS